jgi:hypothetical protein
MDINWNPSKRDLRQFAGIWFPAFFALVGAFVWYRLGSLQMAAFIWGTAFVISLVGFFVPAFMRVIFVGWMVASYPIGWTISHLILTVIYFLVLTPIGLLVRLVVGDPMQRRFDRSAKTYWVPHESSGDSSRYFKQF